MKKSGFLIFLVLSLALTAFLAGYVMVRRGADSTLRSKTGTILDKFNGSGQEDTNLENTKEAIPTPLTERKVLSVVNSPIKNVILYFEKNTGRLFEFNMETKGEQVILDKTMPNFTSAIWSPTKKNFIGTFVSDSKNVFKSFDVTTGKETTMNPGIRSVAFSHDGNLIAYHYLDPVEAENTANPEISPTVQIGKIMISEPDGKYEKKILDTRLSSVNISWPMKDNILLETSAAEVFILSEDGKLSSLFGPSFGLKKVLSPSGKKLIFSYLSANEDQGETMLSIKDLASKEERSLLPASASKCVWSIDDVNLLCAIQKSPSVDAIYLINTIDGSEKLIAEPLMAVRDLLLSPLEDYLVFIGVSDDKLYSIKIDR